MRLRAIQGGKKRDGGWTEIGCVTKEEASGAGNRAKPGKVLKKSNSSDVGKGFVLGLGGRIRGNKEGGSGDNQEILFPGL